MTEWRPAPEMRVKVLGLVFRADRFLAAEVPLSNGAIKGVRPLGGTVEFAETREEALAREFREELGTEIVMHGPWHALENIYVHEGRKGHEYVFCREVTLLEKSIYAREEIHFEDGIPCRAGWYRLELLAGAGLELYPDGLASVMKGLPGKQF